ncbi:arylamine N-acetyltransferase [Paludibacterium sp. B53371]|uniref:arylamine N-acetyltransferase family protein n=1 Tax=Paludibacterium sp. B53371 TaxID=2806263 RepID=UPI001C046928|nr:arylamine N-acetyltransferase [Paludibacterium sp. B53371]
MDAQQRAAYLARLEISEVGPACPESLAHLHLQHLRHIPFENLSLFLDEPLRLDEASLLDKLLTRHRGGFCYELNQAFSLLLTSLGFQVSRLSARVFDGEVFGPPFDHLLLWVHFPEGDMLADVGFGDCFLLPLPLDGEVQRQPSGQFRLQSVHGQCVLQRHDDERGWQPLYQFALEAHPLDEFVHMCDFHQHSPASHFTGKPLCTIARPDGRLTLSGQRLIITLGADRLEQPVSDIAMLRQCLQKHFQIELEGELAARLFMAGATAAVSGR